MDAIKPGVIKRHISAFIPSIQKGTPKAALRATRTAKTDMTIKLILEEDEQEQAFEFEEDTITIGRTAGNHVRIKSSTSSRKHCQIRKTAEGFLVEDLKSRNGTQLNGEDITRRVLSIGDRIEIGTSIIHFSQRLDPGPRKESKARSKSSETRRRKRSDRSPRKSDRVRKRSDRTKRAAVPKASTSRYELQVVGEDRQVDIDTFPFMIGASDKNHLVLDAPNVAPEHCLIIPGNEGLFIKDLGSAMGTMVDGQKISGQPLFGKQTILVGTKVLLVVDTQEGQATKKAPKKPAAKAPKKAQVQEFSLDEDDEDDEAPVTKAPPRSDRQRPIPQEHSDEPEYSDEPELEDSIGQSLTQINAATFEVPQRSMAGPLLAVGAVVAGLVILGVGGLLVTSLVAEVNPDPSPEDNVVKNWSFEEALGAKGAVPGWTLEQTQGVTVEFVKSAKYGQKALAATLTDSAEIEVQSSEPLELGAKQQLLSLRGIFSVEGSGLVGLKARWLSEQGQELGESVAVMTDEEGEERLSGRLMPPADASQMKFVAFARGLGACKVIFDRLEMVELEEKGSTAVINATTCKVRVDERGLVSFHDDSTNVVLANDIGIILTDEDGEALSYGRQSKSRVKVEVKKKGRKLRGSSEIFDESVGKWRRFKFDLLPERKALVGRYRFNTKSIGGRSLVLNFEIPQWRRIKPIMLVSEQGSSRGLRELFQATDKASIIVPNISEMAWKEGAEQMSFRLSVPAALIVRREQGASDASGALQLRFKMVPKQGEAGKECSISFELLSSSSMVRDRIQALFLEAQQARQRGQLGEALRIYRKIAREYQFDDKAKKLARGRETSIMGFANELKDEILAASKDSTNFQTPAILESAEARLKSLKAAFPKSSQTSQAQSAVDQIRSEQSALVKSRNEREAEAYLERAKKFRERGRYALARATFRLIVEKFPADLESVRQAKLFLDSGGQ